MTFCPAFPRQLGFPLLTPVAALCSVDWLPGFVEEYGDQVMGVETQYWAYNARTTGVQPAPHSDGRNNPAPKRRLRGPPSLETSKL